MRGILWSVTVGRVMLVPVFLVGALRLQGLVERGLEAGTLRWGLALTVAVIAASDVLDGWLARRAGGSGVTRIGQLLDPLADKLLVATALVMLLAVGRIPLWGAGMVVVIIGRELAVTGLRGIASSEGQIVAATWPGKLKTLVQNVATVALLLHHEVFGLPAHEIGMTLLAIATALTLWSGYTYFSGYFGGRRSA